MVWFIELYMSCELCAYSKQTLHPVIPDIFSPDIEHRGMKYESPVSYILNMFK